VISKLEHCAEFQIRFFGTGL